MWTEVAKCTLLEDGNIQWDINIYGLKGEDALTWAIAAADMLNHVADVVAEAGMSRKEFTHDCSTIINRELAKPTTELTGKTYKVPWV